MKKIIFLLIYLVPIVVSGQPEGKYSSTDYMWMSVGSAGFTPKYTGETSIAFSQSGEPYLAYSDGMNFNKVNVRKFDGNNWVSIGATGFSIGEAGYLSIVFDLTSTPWVSYLNINNSSFGVNV
jgi:hypothetical protein